MADAMLDARQEGGQVHDGSRLQAPGFVPVRIACEGGPATTGEPGRLAPALTVLPQMASPPGKLGGVVEIEMSGARIRVEPGVELATLSTVLSALRGIR